MTINVISVILQPLSLCHLVQVYYWIMKSFISKLRGRTEIEGGDGVFVENGPYFITAMIHIPDSCREFVPFIMCCFTMNFFLTYSNEQKSRFQR